MTSVLDKLSVEEATLVSEAEAPRAPGAMKAVLTDRRFSAGWVDRSP